MEVIDSTKQKLTLQEVIVRSVHNYQDSMDIPVANALLLIMEELKLPDSEAIQFGNSVFITHYMKNKRGAVMRILNVDTAKNVLANVELYIRRLMQLGVEELVTTYTQKSFEMYLREVERRKIGTYEVKKIKDDYYVGIVKLPMSKKYRGKNL